MPSDFSLRKFLSVLRGPALPAKSLYLPTTPPPKFPPRTLPRLPNEVVLNLVSDMGFQATFPFKFNKKDGYPNDIFSFNDTISEMSKDRSFVIKCPVSIRLSSDPPLVQSFKLQYRFSQHLLQRVSSRLHGIDPSVASPYNFLIDLIVQLVSHRDKLKIQVDEIGAYWVRLRKAAPYRENSFYRNVTAHLHHFSNLIDIIYAEDDHDIDTQYQYEWMSDMIKQFLEGKAPNPL